MTDSFAKLRAVRHSKEPKSFVKYNNVQPAAELMENTTQKVPEHDLESLTTLPLGLETRSSSTAGRGIWANKSHPAGSILISTRPHVAVLSSQYLASHCSSCFDASITLKRCTRCQVVWYCDTRCQNDDWAFHKNECMSLQKWIKFAPSPDLSIPNDAIRCLGRLLWKKQKEGLQSLWSRQIDSMQSHRSSLPSSATEMHIHLAHSITRYLDIPSIQKMDEFGISSAGDLVDIISRFTTNSFTVASPSLTPLGVSVAPLVSLLNHSCDPNAVIVYPRTSKDRSREPLMQVIALRSIHVNEEVVTAYIDTTYPRAHRQKSLMDTYNFTCHCGVCNSYDSDRTDPRTSMFCPKSCGGACPLPTTDNDIIRCNRCKAAVLSSDAVTDAVRVGQDGLEKATSLQFRDPTKSRQLTSHLIPILLSAGLLPSAHPLLALSRLHQSLLISSLDPTPTQDTLDDIIRITNQSVAGLEALLCEGHPVRGIALAELGKMLAVDEPSSQQPSSLPTHVQTFPPSGPPRLRLAYDTLLKARKELLIGFGTANEGGQTGKDVREMLVSLEKEISVWKQGMRNVIEDRPKAVRC